MNKMSIVKQSVFLGVVIISIVLISCGKQYKGEGEVTTEILSISDFSGVGLTFSDNVTIKQGATQEVKAIGHANIIERIKTSVSDNFWKIGLEDGNYTNYELSIEITLPNLNRLKLSGSGNLTANDFTNQSDLDVALSGSGNINLNNFEGTTNLDVAISGSGNINLNNFEGTTNLDVKISGSGDFVANDDISALSVLKVKNSGSGEYRGFELSAESVTVSLSGSGDTELTATNLLDVSLSGSGDVSYKGNPSITQKITGSGKLIDAN